jgi:hypothetical protein
MISGTDIPAVGKAMVSTAESKSREGLIRGSLDIQSNKIDQLGAEINLLIERIVPVIAMEPLASEKNPNEENQTISDVRRHIEKNTASLIHLARSVREALEVLEV